MTFILKKTPLPENPLCQLYLWMKPDNGKKLWNYQLLLYVQKFDTEPTAASTTAVLNLRIYLHTKSTNLELSLHAYNKYIFFQWLLCTISEQLSSLAQLRNFLIHEVSRIPFRLKEWKKNSKANRSAAKTVWQVIAGIRNGGTKEEWYIWFTWKN